jgi:hypothetical protein
VTNYEAVGGDVWCNSLAFHQKLALLKEIESFVFIVMVILDIACQQLVPSDFNQLGRRKLKIN